MLESMHPPHVGAGDGVGWSGTSGASVWAFVKQLVAQKRAKAFRIRDGAIVCCCIMSIEGRLVVVVDLNNRCVQRQGMVLCFPPSGKIYGMTTLGKVPGR